MFFVKWVLQGHWMHHPLHAMLAHLPAGLWPTVFVLDCISYVRGGDLPSVTLTGWWCILVGLVAASAAVPTGLAEWVDIKPGRPARTLGLIHAGINVGVFGVFVADFVIRCLDGVSEPRVTLVQLVLSAIGTGMLLISGYLGGRLVYEHGVRVARDSKPYWIEAARQGGATLPAQK
jgi:uncharacterized membrane protein